MEHIFITMAPYAWGKAATMEESINNCRKIRRGATGGFKDYDVYKAHPLTEVDGMGGFSYPADESEPMVIGKNAPVLIKRVRKGKQQTI